MAAGPVGLNEMSTNSYQGCGYLSCNSMMWFVFLNCSSLAFFENAFAKKTKMQRNTHEPSISPGNVPVWDYFYEI